MFLKLIFSVFETEVPNDGRKLHYEANKNVYFNVQYISTQTVKRRNNMRNCDSGK